MVHRLRCGVAISDSFLNRIGSRESDLCSVCNTRSTSNHVLLSCLKYEQPRKVWFEKIAKGCDIEITIKTLFYQDVLTHPIDFLITTQDRVFGKEMVSR